MHIIDEAELTTGGGDSFDFHNTVLEERVAEAIRTRPRHGRVAELYAAGSIGVGADGDVDRVRILVRFDEDSSVGVVCCNS